jgi:hypothetical protein
MSGKILKNAAKARAAAILATLSWLYSLIERFTTLNRFFIGSIAQTSTQLIAGRPRALRPSVIA